MLRLIFLLLVIALAAAVKYLPWWALVGGVVLVIGFLKFFGVKLLVWIISMPFRAKGRVLRGAEVEVLSLRRVAGPLAKLSAGRRDQKSTELGPSIPPTSRDYFELEVHITPRAPRGNFRFWEPAELGLVRPGKKMADADETCEIVSLYVMGETAASTDEEEGLKYTGPQKLRLCIGVLPGTKQLVFQYYFEEFGDIQLDQAK